MGTLSYLPGKETVWGPIVETRCSPGDDAVFVSITPGGRQVQSRLPPSSQTDSLLGSFHELPELVSVAFIRPETLPSPVPPKAAGRPWLTGQAGSLGNNK